MTMSREGGRGDCLQKKSGDLSSLFCGGSQQIRTAVDGFADRYLATRSGNHFCFAMQRYGFFFKRQNYLRVFSGLFVQFLRFSSLVGRFIPLSLQSAVQCEQADASSGWRIIRKKRQAVQTKAAAMMRYAAYSCHMFFLFGICRAKIA